MAGFRAIAEGAVHGFLHQPSHPIGHALALTHGAGANCQAPLLTAVANAFAEAGWWVLRYDLPFRQKRKFGPPSPATASLDRQGIKDSAAYLHSVSGCAISVGGHSYGGRQTSMLLADDPTLAEGLLLLSYPLHPPNKPQQLRSAHFPNLNTPALFVHGTKDDFGSPEEMHTAAAQLQGRAQIVTINGAGHDLKKGGFDLHACVVQPFSMLVSKQATVA